MTTYIKSKIDGERYCKANGQFTRHLKNYDLTYQEYIEIYDLGYTPLCECLRPLSFYKKDNSYAGSCGDPICVGRTISKTKAAWSDEKRKIDSANKKIAAKSRTQEQIELTKQKRTETNLEKYGVEWSFQAEEVKKKARNTKIFKYGDPDYNNSKKSRTANISKLPEEKDKINKKRINTNLKRYGVENTFVFVDKSKSAKTNNRVKEYILPSGKVLGLRGYEPFVIDHLLNELELKENDFLVHDFYSKESSVGIFEYINVNKHKAKYYPDIHIPSENLIIEVKGRWWWDGYGEEKYKSRLENNIRKAEAVASSGYEYQVWLFESKLKYEILTYGKDF